MSGYNAYQYANQVPYNYLSTSPAYIYTQPQFQPQVPQQTQQSQQGGINWVQGEAGAKSFVVGAGQSVMLMDSENSVFYIKSTDASGMPLPLRIFDYTERVQNVNPISNPVVEDVQNKYVTKEEFETALNAINATIQQMSASKKIDTNTRKKGNNNESAVQSFK